MSSRLVFSVCCVVFRFVVLFSLVCSLVLRFAVSLLLAERGLFEWAFGRARGSLVEQTKNTTANRRTREQAKTPQQTEKTREQTREKQHHSREKPPQQTEEQKTIAERTVPQQTEKTPQQTEKQETRTGDRTP